jgi:hypothetical protein
MTDQDFGEFVFLFHSANFHSLLYAKKVFLHDCHEV